MTEMSESQVVLLLTPSTRRRLFSGPNGRFCEREHREQDPGSERPRPGERELRLRRSLHTGTRFSFHPSKPAQFA